MFRKRHIIVRAQKSKYKREIRERNTAYTTYRRKVVYNGQQFLIRNDVVHKEVHIFQVLK